jgi:hypothetical protein
MMTIFLVAMVAACPQTTVINRSKEPIVDFDMSTMRNAQKRCVAHFPDSPCLLRFYKLAPRSYHATCGKGNKSDPK